MEEIRGEKIERTLSIYTRLLDGEVVNKAAEAERYGVNARTIQRDIDDIRNFLEQESEKEGFINSIIYDRAKKGYVLEQIYRMKFTNAEILAVCKILLSSRAFRKGEMTELLEKLIMGCVPEENRKLVKELVKNELFHYTELQHKTPFLEKLWSLAQAIKSCSVIEMTYQRLKGSTPVVRKVHPVGIMFSEFYFYLTAFIEDEATREDFDVINDSYPTIYRVDRIKKLKVLDEHFHIPYSSRFEEGEFRKRIQFMYGGRLRRVRFKYKGYSIEAVLDRLPTAKILSEDEDGWLVEAEVFGDGIDMWFRSQGEMVEKL